MEKKKEENLLELCVIALTEIGYNVECVQGESELCIKGHGKEVYVSVNGQNRMVSITKPYWHFLSQKDLKKAPLLRRAVNEANKNGHSLVTVSYEKVLGSGEIAVDSRYNTLIPSDIEDCKSFFREVMKMFSRTERFFKKRFQELQYEEEGNSIY